MHGSIVAYTKPYRSIGVTEIVGCYGLITTKHCVGDVLEVKDNFGSFYSLGQLSVCVCV